MDIDKLKKDVADATAKVTASQKVLADAKDVLNEEFKKTEDAVKAVDSTTKVEDDAIKKLKDADKKAKDAADAAATDVTLMPQAQTAALEAQTALTEQKSATTTRKGAEKSHDDAKAEYEKIVEDVRVKQKQVDDDVAALKKAEQALKKATSTPVSMYVSATLIVLVCIGILIGIVYAASNRNKANTPTAIITSPSPNQNQVANASPSAGTNKPAVNTTANPATSPSVNTNVVVQPRVVVPSVVASTAAPIVASPSSSANTPAIVVTTSAPPIPVTSPSPTGSTVAAGSQPNATPTPDLQKQLIIANQKIDNLVTTIKDLFKEKGIPDVKKSATPSQSSNKKSVKKHKPSLTAQQKYQLAEKTSLEKIRKLKAKEDQYRKTVDAKLKKLWLLKQQDELAEKAEAEKASSDQIAVKMKSHRDTILARQKENQQNYNKK